MSLPPTSGPQNGSAPHPPTPEQIRKLRLRGDRLWGVVLFGLGIFATVMNMLSVTEQSLSMQAAEVFRQFNIGDYQRPEILASIAWPAIVLHVVNYAVWLFVAIKRWQSGKFGMWCALLGAVVGLLISFAAACANLLVHPEIVAMLQSH